MLTCDFLPPNSDVGTTPMDFLRTVIDPEHYCTMPPTLNNGITVMKKIQYTGRFVLDDTHHAPGLGLRGVSESTGAVIWYPGHSIGACYRYGIIQNGLFNSYADGGATYLYFQSANIVGNQYQQYGALSGFLFNSGLPLPYVNTDSQYQTYVHNRDDEVVRISPSLNQINETFSRARVFAGALRMELNSVSISGTPFPGVFGAAALDDIRSAFLDPNKPTGSFPTGYLPAVPRDVVPLDFTIMQQTNTSVKDIISDIPLEKGIACVLGPDVPTKLKSVSSIQQDNLEGQYLFIGPIANNLVTTPILQAAITPASNFTNLWLGWVTPYDIWVYDVGMPAQGGPAFKSGSSSQTALNWQQIQVSSINPLGCLETTLNLRFGSYAIPGSEQTTTYQETVCFQAYHVFAAVSDDGTIRYTLCQEQEQDMYPPPQSGGYPQTNGFGRIWTACPKYYQASYTRQQVTDQSIPSQGYSFPAGGQYVGTQLRIFVRNDGSAVGSYPCTYLSGGNISVRARNLWQDGELGPVRVMKWEGVTTTSNQPTAISFNGDVLCEMVPGPRLAPFVQANRLNIPRACPYVSVYPFLSALFNDGSTSFCRCYINDRYNDFIRRVVPSFTANSLLKVGETKAILEAAVACGILPPSALPVMDVTKTRSYANNTKQLYQVRNSELDTGTKRLRDMDAYLESKEKKDRLLEYY